MHRFDGILPPGLTRRDGTPPPAPASFDDDYTLPEHCEKPLQALHPHPNDAHLCFYEKEHIYTWRGAPTTTSVTALAHEYESPFVPHAAVRMMHTSRSQRWPRLEYVTEPRAGLGDWTPARGALVHVDGKTVAVLQPHSVCDTAADVMGLLRASAIKGHDVDAGDVHTFERAMTFDEITAGWKRKGMRASHLGTEAHYQAELCLNGLPFRHYEPEMEVLRRFLEEHALPRGLVAHLTEKEIVCEDADVAGSVDAILYDPARAVYHIVDYKRSDKLQSDLRGYGMMRAPFTHLDDCKGAGYALQLSIYQWILERDYGMQFGDRVLLSLHPDRAFATAVPYLHAEVEHIMRLRMRLVAARRAVAAAHPELVCALTGAPLVDAVRLDDGRLAMERAALVRELPHTTDADTRARFESVVAAQLADDPVPTFDAAQQPTWRRRVMPGGMVPFEC